MSDDATAIRAFIARQKLAELQAYRARLHAAYDAIDEAAAAAASNVEALRARYEGLKAIEVTGRQVHPEVANLEIVLVESDDPAQVELVAQWTGRLVTVARQGRARADAITLFGGLLGERLDAERAMPDAGDTVREFIASLATTGGKVAIEPILARIAETIGDGELRELRRVVADRSRAHLDAEAAAEELPFRIDRLSGRRELPAETRAFLRSMVESHLQSGSPSPTLREFRAAFGLAWGELPTWQPGAARLEPIWTRNRWRVAPRYETLDLLWIDEIGRALTTIASSVEGLGRRNRLERLRQLVKLQAPPVIVDNERRMLAESFDLSGLTRGFSWLGSAEACTGDALTDYEAAPAIARQRIAALAEVIGASLDDYSGDDYATTGIAKAFAIARAELELAASLGVEDATVIKTDLRDFFPSCPHALVGALLRWLGVDDALIGAVERILAGEFVAPDGERVRAQRGLPLELALSRTLAGLVMSLLVGYVRAEVDVLVYNLVDDLVIFARTADEAATAWAAVERFTAAAGLTLNLAKSGHCRASGVGDPRLPAGAVRWGMLALRPDGAWIPSDDALTTFAAVSRRRILGHGALLDRTRAYREQLAYLLVWLAPAADLAPDHLDAVWRAVEDFARMALDGDPGIIAHVRRVLGERFLEGGPVALPDAWLHWPITAGGLALPHAATELVPYRLPDPEEATDDTAPAPSPTREDDPDAGRWYGARTAVRAPAPPAETAASQADVEAFIARGRDVKADAQRDLAPVWRWILATFGPSIVEHFGSHDFISSDLVPLDVIRGR